MKDKKKMIIVLSSLSIFVVIGFLIIAFPFFNEIKRSSKKLSSTQRDLKEMIRKNRELSYWREREDELENYLQELESVLVNPDMPVGFIEFVEEAASYHEVEVNVSLLSSPEENKDSFFTPLGIRITGWGEEQDCLAFLDRVEKSHYLLSIEEFSISSVDKERPGRGEREEGARMDLKIQILGYED